MILFLYQRNFFYRMEIYRPLRAVLFGYELLRLLFLAFSFAFFSSLQAVLMGGIYPFLVYMSSNALFPLICFFIFLRPGEYRNYVPLYMAGKTIAVVLFYAWAFFTFSLETGIMEQRFLGRGDYIEILVLSGGAFFFGLGDVFSILGTWALKKKLALGQTDGGIGCG